MADSDRQLTLDALMPDYDVVITETVPVRADPSTTLRAARELDLLTVHSPILDAAMWIRGLPARLMGRSAPIPPRLVITEGGLPGWLALAESEHEFVFGAVGRFWTPIIVWRDVTRGEFGGFDEPGWGKIAANFTVTPQGTGTLLSYECRTATTDPVARRRFLRYWRLVRPFVGHIMRAALATIKDNAERMGFGQELRNDSKISR